MASRSPCPGLPVPIDLASPPAAHPPITPHALCAAAGEKERCAHPEAAPSPPEVVTRAHGSCGGAEFDACVAGGTLGILLALALQQRGHRVAVVERRRLEGRSQGAWRGSPIESRELCVRAPLVAGWRLVPAVCSPANASFCPANASSTPLCTPPPAEWNIGRSELRQLTTCGLLSEAEVASCVVSQWPSVRCVLRAAAASPVGGAPARQAPASPPSPRMRAPTPPASRRALAGWPSTGGRPSTVGGIFSTAA